MIGSKNFDQSSGDGSINSQGLRDSIVVVGLSYSDARQLFMDLAQTMFADLTREAYEIAEQRAEEITHKILEAFISEEININAASDPDFQFACSAVQKEYIRSGDKNLGDLLVSLLVQRSQEEKKNLAQIILNEAIEVCPKLTDKQLDIIAIVFYLTNLTLKVDVDKNRISQDMDTFLTPFIDCVEDIGNNVAHLSYTGCATQMSFATSIASQLVGAYPEFMKELPEKEREAEVQSILEEKYPGNHRTDFFKSNTQHLYHTLRLSSVGLALGYSHLKRKVGFSSDISRWVG